MFIKDTKNSFNYAIKGIKSAFKSERNLRTHAFALSLVIALGIILKFRLQDWAIIAMVSAMVISLELVNTAIEKVCNFIHPGQLPSIGQIKDISAGAVLVAAFFAVVTGTFIVLKYLAI